MEVILTKQDLEAFVNRAGFLPSSGERAPFCLEKLCPNPWHTDQASDPWRWRMEIAQEGNIAYGKFFHSLSGYIAADCLPAFIALRRGGLTARELYEDGLLGRESMALYELLEQEGGQPAHLVLIVDDGAQHHAGAVPGGGPLGQLHRPAHPVAEAR